MLCEGCSKNKLRKEFPPANVCDKDHAPLHCIKCVMSSVQRKKMCPTCDSCVTVDEPLYKACVKKFEYMFPPFESEEEACAEVSEGAYGHSRSKLEVKVVMLNGDKKSITVSRSESVKDLKDAVKIAFGVDPRKQRLLYQEKPLETYKSNRLTKLGDYNITNNSTITLIKVLKTIEATLRKVTFDFSWEYVGFQRDFLNASAIVYSGTNRVDYVDFKNQYGADVYLRSYGFGSVSHSGHGFRGNRYGKRGRHVIQVNLESLPGTVDKIFFTLSALNAVSIHDFENLELSFYDTGNPTEQLCGDTISHSIDDKAVVFCCLCRIDGVWQVLSLQEPSSGNVRFYGGLFLTIDAIIRKGFS